MRTTPRGRFRRSIVTTGETGASVKSSPFLSISASRMTDKGIELSLRDERSSRRLQGKAEQQVPFNAQKT